LLSPRQNVRIGKGKEPVDSMMGTGLMSDRDRLDRIERKINRIGRFVLFGLALFLVAAAVLAEGYYDRLVIGYGNVIAAALVVIVLVFFVWARAPFRD
jgi:membrane glycosyltransferase